MGIDEMIAAAKARRQKNLVKEAERLTGYVRRFLGAELSEALDIQPDPDSTLVRANYHNQTFWMKTGSSWLQVYLDKDTLQDWRIFVTVDDFLLYLAEF